MWLLYWWGMTIFVNLTFFFAERKLQNLCVWNWYMSNVQRSTFNASLSRGISLCLFFASHFFFGGKVNLVSLKLDSLSLQTFLPLSFSVSLETNILFVENRTRHTGKIMWTRRTFWQKLKKKFTFQRTKKYITSDFLNFVIKPWHMQCREEESGGDVWNVLIFAYSSYAVTKWEKKRILLRQLEDVNIDFVCNIFLSYTKAFEL